MCHNCHWINVYGKKMVWKHIALKTSSVTFL